MGFISIFILMMGIIAGLIVIIAFGIGAIALGIGGVVSSSFIKDKLIKQLLVITFSIILTVGAICASLLLIANDSSLVMFLVELILGVVLLSLGIFGVKISRVLENMIAKVIFRIIFFTAIAAGLLLIVPLLIIGIRVYI